MELGDPSEPPHAPKEGPALPCRIPHHDLPRCYVANDSGLCRDLGPGTNLDMADHSTLSTKLGPLSDTSRTGNAHLGDDQGARPHMHVVGDMDQVVDLGALPDHRTADGAAVDGTVGSNLHSGSQDALTHLGYLLEFTGDRCIPKSVYTDS